MLLETSFVAAWLAFAVVSTLGREDGPPALDAAVLQVAEGDDQYMGLFLDGQRVGWSRTRQTPIAEGFQFEQEARFRVNSMGTVHDIATTGSAETDAKGHVRSFRASVGAQTPILVEGRWADGVMHVTLRGAGDRPTDMELAMPVAPVIGQTIGAWVEGQTLAPGARFTVPYFDPVTQTATTGDVVVQNPEVLPDGEPGWWLKTDFGGFQTRRLVDARGRVLREESTMGIGGTLLAVAMTRGEAMRDAVAAPPELTALASVPVEAEPGATVSTLQVSGIDTASLRSQPPVQVVTGDTVTISVPLLAELRHDLPVAGTGDTEATALLPATHPEIVAKAREVVGDATDRLAATQRLVAFVDGYLEKVPVVDVPDGLAVLRAGKGDCNEHTALFVSLARALGIPSRIAAGLVYHPALGQAYFYHAWPEVRLGPDDASGQAGWVPVDPTFGQLPADARHLKLVEGDLAQQAQILSVMGRIRLRVVR